MHGAVHTKGEQNMSKQSVARKRKAQKNLKKAKVQLARFNRRARVELARHTRALRLATKRYRMALKG
jgi:hypothetical protein